MWKMKFEIHLLYGIIDYIVPLAHAVSLYYSWLMQTGLPFERRLGGVMIPRSAPTMDGTNCMGVRIWNCSHYYKAI